MDSRAFCVSDAKPRFAKSFMKTNSLLTEPEPTSSGVHGRNARQTPLVTPAKLRRDIPLSSKAQTTVRNARRAISDIIAGRDKERLLVVCGPCSIDDVNAALVYAERLRKLGEELGDKLVVVMRTYFEKPRSVVGWKGLAYEPLNEQQVTPSAGVAIARRLIARINDMGLPCATEFLNPLVAMYLEDGISYGSIGSRTVESQIHRELSSSLEMPVGMKNGMDGKIDAAVNGVKSAMARHSYFGQNQFGEACLIESNGNPDSHVILRGGSNGPNYHAAIVNEAIERVGAMGQNRPVVVDCSHGNSSKDHRRQSLVADSVEGQIRQGQRGIAGLMLESNLVEGRQDAENGEARVFGQSITDACIGWADTEKIIRNLAV